MAAKGAPVARPEIVGLGPVAARSLVFSVGGELHVGVAVKATFSLAPGLATLAAPRPLLLEDERQPAGTSTRWPSDVVPFRPRAEVLFQGRVHAPPAGETREMLARMTVQRVLGGARHVLVDRRIRVRGAPGADGQPTPFREMEIVWENALLGPENPLGLEQPCLLDVADPARPVCLGPEHATVRRQRSGITPDDRQQVAAAEPDLRADFPWDFFHYAPEAQRLPFLVGDEWIGLQGLHPFLPLLETRLPGVNAAARIYGLSGEGLPEGTELRLVADALLVDGDALQASVVWRGHFGVADASLIEPMTIAVGVALPGVPIAWPAQAVGAPTETVGAPTIEAEPDEEPPPARRGAPPAGEPIPAGPETSLPTTLDQTRAPGTARPSSLPFAPSPGAPAVFTPPAVFPEPEEAAPNTIILPVPGARPAPTSAERREALRFAPEGTAPRSVRSPGAGAPAAPAPEPETEDDVPVGLATRSRVPVLVAPEPGRGRPPFVAFTFPWSLEPPDPSLIVVCKGTWELAPDGSLRPAEEPELPTGELLDGEDPLASALAPSDFAPFKPRADVLLLGTAHAPGGRASRAEVRLRLGDLERRVAVLGDRRWEGLLTLRASEPAPFERIPLRWERAFGGPGHAANPVGRGAIAAPDAPLPNLEDPERPVDGPSSTPPPAGLGPVPSAWKERTALLGTYDAAWAARRWPYFPADFDWAYFQCAPRPQQIPHPQGDERFALAGVHPSGALEGRLPGVRARAVARRTSGEEVDVVMRLDTICFDADRMRLTLTWRGQLPVDDDAASDVEDVLLLAEPAGETRSAEEVRQARRLARLADGEELTDVDAVVPENDAARREAILDAHAAKVRARLEAAGVLSRVAPLPRPERPAAPPPPVPLRPELRAQVEARLAEGATLDSLDLQAADLRGLSLRGRSLVGANLKDARLDGVDLTGAWLGRAVLVGAELSDAILIGADLDGADLTAATLDGATLDEARLDGAILDGCSAAGVSFERVTGAAARFQGARLEGARFSRAELPDADFSGARLGGARFDDAKLARVRLLESHAAGASFDRASMPGARANQANLERATLRAADLAGASFDDALLASASLLGAQGKGATFVSASARGATLSGCELGEGRFQGADLTGANLARANLMKASFEGARLVGADLRGANLHAAEVWKAELGDAKLDGAITTQSKLAGLRR